MRESRSSSTIHGTTSAGLVGPMIPEAAIEDRAWPIPLAVAAESKGQTVRIRLAILGVVRARCIVSLSNPASQRSRC